MGRAWWLTPYPAKKISFIDDRCLRFFNSTLEKVPKKIIVVSRFTGSTVDGSEIRRSPVEVGSLSHYFQGFIYSKWLFGISSTKSIISAVEKRWTHPPGLVPFLWLVTWSPCPNFRNLELSDMKFFLVDRDSHKAGRANNNHKKTVSVSLILF